MSSGFSYNGATHVLKSGDSMSGNLGLNVISPSAILHVSGSSKFENSLILSKDIDSTGMKVDCNYPTFPWVDWIGNFRPDPGGQGAPSINPFIGNVRGYFYSINDLMDVEIHVPHDYAEGTDVFYPYPLESQWNINKRNTNC